MVELKIDWGKGFEFHGLFLCEGAAMAAAAQDAPGREFAIEGYNYATGKRALFGYDQDEFMAKQHG